MIQTLLKEKYIPKNGKIVPKEFIDFVLNSNDVDFFQYFDFVNVQIPNLFLIREELKKSLFSEIAIINQDFYNESIYNKESSFIYLKNIIESLGFESIHQIKDNQTIFPRINNLEEVISFIEKSQFHKTTIKEPNDEHPFYSIDYEIKTYMYYNSDNGFLWNVSTDGKNIIKSDIFGNVSKRDSFFNNFTNIQLHKLLYGDIYSFHMDMTTLPIHNYENILMYFKPVKEWFVFPNELFIRYYYEIQNIETLKNILDNQYKNVFDPIFNYNCQGLFLENNLFAKSQKFKDFDFEERGISDIINLTDYLCFGSICFDAFKDNLSKHLDITDKDLILLINYYFKNEERKKLSSYSENEIYNFVKSLKRKYIKLILKNKNDFINIYNLKKETFYLIEELLSIKQLL